MLARVILPSLASHPTNGMAVYQIARHPENRDRSHREKPMSQEHGFDLEVSEDDEDVAYLRLPGHPGSAPGVVKRTVRLHDLVGDYEGPDIYLDFGEGDTLIGIEIVG